MFVYSDPPKVINLKDIRVDSGEDEGNECQMKVYIGVNEACSTKSRHNKGAPAPTENLSANKKQDETMTIEEGEGQIIPREICTTYFGKEGDMKHGCSDCNGVDINLKKLWKSMVDKKYENDGIHSFCVIMKRFVPFQTDHARCKGKVKVDLVDGKGLGHISCPVRGKIEGGDIGGNKKRKESVLRKGRNKEDMGDRLGAGHDIRQDDEEREEQSNFGWRRMVGYWPYLATVLAGFIGLASLFIMIG